MFKKIKIQVTIFLLSLIVWSCSQDEGNYAYNAINELNIKGIEKEYTAFTGDVLKITPELNPTIDDGSVLDRYTYEWVALDLSKLPFEQKTVLATTKNFNAPVKLPPAKYTLYYLVKDNTTGVTWQSPTFKLNVVSSIYEGFLVIGDADGKARLDMVSIIPGIATPRIINDVLDASGSALKLKGKAVDVDCFNLPFVSPLMYGIYVTASESGTSRIEQNTFAWKPTQNISYESVGGAFADNFVADFMSSNNGGGFNILYSKGDVYLYNRTSQTRYGLPQNKVDVESQTFKAAPYIAFNTGGGAAGPPVLYDEVKGRFLRLIVNSGNCSAMPTVTPSATVLDWNNTNSDLKFMTTSGFGGANFESLAVLQNKTTKKFNLLRFSRLLAQTYYKEILNAPDIDKAKLFAVTSDTGYLFYAVGGKLYEYDNGTQTAKLMLDKGSEEITYLNVDAKARTFAKKLLVGSYGTTGKLEVFTVPPVNGNLVLDNSFSGLVKILDVAYRAR